jgi:hypothetical protein
VTANASASAGVDVAPEKKLCGGAKTVDWWLDEGWLTGQPDALAAGTGITGLAGGLVHDDAVEACPFD